MMFLAIALIATIIPYPWRNTINCYRKIVLSLSLLAHLFVGVIIIPNIPYEWDIPTFHRASLQILTGGLPDAATSVGSFAAFQAIVYAIFGADPTSLSIINSVLAILIPFPVMYIAKRLYPSALRFTDGLFVLVLLLPTPFFFTTIPMRDAFSVLVFLSLLTLLVTVLIDDQPLAGVLAVPLNGVLYLLRPELAVIVVLSIGAALIVHILDQITVREVELPTLIGLLSLPSILGVLVVAPRLPLEPLNRRVQFRSSGGAAYLDGMTYDTGYEVLLVAPARALYFQFAPFPLHVNAAFDFAAVLMLPILILLTISAYRSLMQADTEKSVFVFLILVYVGGTVGYGLIDSNFGTTARHRIPFTLLLVVFASPTIQRWELAIRDRFGESPR